MNTGDSRMKSYQDLIVWRKGIDLVEEIYSLTMYLPNSEKFGLIPQMRRSAISIPANIAEGWGRKSTGNFIQYLNISSGSLAELMTQLEIIKRLKLVDLSEITKSESLGIEISKMLFVLIKNLEKRARV